VFGNDAAARGWLARAERLLRDVAPGAEQGWIDLARSEGSRESSAAAMYAEAALDSALAAGDIPTSSFVPSPSWDSRGSLAVKSTKV
jgi:hypothetical protein